MGLSLGSKEPMTPKWSAAENEGKAEQVSRYSN